VAAQRDEVQKVDARLFAIAFLTAVGLAAGIGGYLSGQNNNKTTNMKVIEKREISQADHTQFDSFLEDVKSESGNEKKRPIVSHLQNSGGKIVRRFSFPDYPIGDVRWKTGSMFYSRPAKGNDCDVPAGVPVTLVIDAFLHAAVLDNPNLFLRIAPTEFGGLTIKGARIMDPALTADILKSAANWSALQAITLESVNGDKPVLSILNEMHQVNSLRLSRIANLDGNWLANQPFIVRQEKLDLSDIDADPTIRHLATIRNINLRLLSLENTGVSSGAIASLQNCPCLAVLIFEDKNVDDEKLRAITLIRSLVTLNIRNMRLSPAQIRILAGAKSLAAIYLPEKSYKESERAAIKRLDPRIRFGDN
jgi:hypothetical protein